jgi:phosphate transport system protein
MPKHLQRDLDGLRQDILRLAADVEQAIHRAVAALRGRDAVLARQVIDGEGLIDQEENQVDEECLKILALHQPVAVDLRQVAAVMRINTALERMGDLAEGMAKRALALSAMSPASSPDQLQPMADLTTAMVRQALEAFVALDLRQARAVCRMDAEVDRLSGEAIDELTGLMKRSPEAVEAGLSLFTAVRQLKGIADHATSVAEDVIYLVAGEMVRHRPEALRRRDDED